jgi:integrase
MYFPAEVANGVSAVRPVSMKLKRVLAYPRNFDPMHGHRHVYASMLASSGKVDMYALQRLLTHKDPRITQR